MRKKERGKGVRKGVCILRIRNGLCWLLGGGIGKEREMKI